MKEGSCLSEGLSKKEAFKPSSSAPPQTNPEIGRTKHEGKVKRTTHNAPRSGMK